MDLFDGLSSSNGEDADDTCNPLTREMETATVTATQD